MTGADPVLTPLGESAITLAYGNVVDPALNARVLRAAAAVRQAGLPAVRELVPAYAALTVWYDPLHVDAATMIEQLARVVRHADALPDHELAGREHRIPVRYDGPDLDEVARQTGLSRAEVVRRHAAPWYRVYLLGFAPGFAYLGDLDPALALARRGTPRKRVPAGSVGIAGAQTAIYPLDTPGGWHLIGHAEVTCFDPERSPPSLFQPGDRVRFEPVGR